MIVGRRRFLTLAGAGLAAGAFASRVNTSAEVEIPSADIAYDPLRPEFHLLPQHNWMNDPNGPIWWKGKYHLFYQLNPHASVWGDMHWGHAVSTDMVHWRHESIALAPTPGGPDSEGCFSGSTVVYDGVPTFIYTGVQNAPPDQVTLRDGGDKLRETQLLATAEDDELLRWKKLEAPVVAVPPPGMTVTGFRDPCPWREKDGWYLGVGSGERGKGGCVLLYRSEDLLHWTYLHKLAEGRPNGKVAANPCDSGEMWECPDFFEVDGRHCLLYSTENKVIWATGEYDAQAHMFATKQQGVLDHGAYYAPKSFLAHDGRRILWGWIRETRPEAEFAAAGWAGAMALPRVLTINKQGQLEMQPAKEVESLRAEMQRAECKAGVPCKKLLGALRTEIEIPAVPLGSTARVRLVNGGAKIWELSIDRVKSTVQCGDVQFAFPSMQPGSSALRMFLDGSVIEVFVAGTEALTSRLYTVRPAATELELSVEGTEGVNASIWALQAISKDRLTS